ncbi:MAG: glycosyltransferase family 4 protein [Candidatus Alcyoniella australis]|nr:glycosyltransferase family 4 protein [Candidatus Alcyoniella australis]
MRIWVVARVDLSSRKGGASHVEHFVREVCARGHEVRLFMPRPVGKLPELPCDCSLLPSGGRSFWAAHLLFELAAFFTMLRLASKERPRRVYLRHGLFCLLPLVAARLLRVPAAVEQNGVIAAELKMAGRPRWEIALQRRFERTAYSLAQWIVTVTQGIKQHVVNDLSVPEPKVFVVPNGADPQRLQPRDAAEAKRSLKIDPDELAVGYLGNFEPYQDLDTLIEALALLNGRGVRFTALIVGSGTRFEQVTALARERGVYERCLFTGAVSHDLVEQHIAAMDVCVVPKRPLTSGYSPIKLFEYLACGRPVVVSDLPGFEIVAENGLGLTAAAEDPTALAEALERLLGDEQLRGQMGRRGRAYAQGPGSWSQTVRNVLEVIGVQAA